MLNNERGIHCKSVTLRLEKLQHLHLFFISFQSEFDSFRVLHRLFQHLHEICHALLARHDRVDVIAVKDAQLATEFLGKEIGLASVKKGLGLNILIQQPYTILDLF